MALNRNVTIDEVEAWAYMADFTTGTPAAYTMSPIRGEIIGLKAVQGGTSAGTTSVITAAINGTAITGGTISIAAGAAGAANSTIITNPGITARVNEGDTISFTSGGQSNDGTVPLQCMAIIRNRRG